MLLRKGDAVVVDVVLVLSSLLPFPALTDFFLFVSSMEGVENGWFLFQILFRNLVGIAGPTYCLLLVYLLTYKPTYLYLRYYVRISIIRE